MFKQFCVALGFLSFASSSFSQYNSSLPAGEWVDSVFSSLNRKQQIAQLMIIRAHSNLGPEHVNSVTRQVKKYRVGGLCFFQGGPVRQANLTNYYQSIAKTPLMITMDAEWGIGMRLDSVKNYQRQMMLGAMPNAQTIYAFGRAVGEQCKRLGVHVNFAPVVDVNNNPANPVINDRSFGENKYKVALYGIQYIKGLQDAGVMACAKHFPGHGDVTVDSHLDLPVIAKTRQQLDSLELYPFKQAIKEGVGSIMIAHLYIPAIDTTANQATSLSYNTVTKLLKQELGFTGLTFTDALEMKGITKFYPAGEASLQSMIAGNDLLCLPEDVPGSIKRIRKAIRKKQIAKDDFESRVKKVLLAKYHLGLNHATTIDTTNLTHDLNAQTEQLKTTIASQAITLLKQETATFPIKPGKIAYVAIGLDSANTLAKTMVEKFKADVFLFGFKRDASTVAGLAEQLKQYEQVVIGLQNYSRRPANQFGISDAAIKLVNTLQTQTNAITLVFGNPYAIAYIAPTAKNLLACYENDEATQQVAAAVLAGEVTAKGELPVTVTENLHYGTKLVANPYFPFDTLTHASLDGRVLDKIDSIATDAIKSHATPGCVVLVAKNGKVAFERAYGYTGYDSVQAVNTNMIYDLASVTKISATTVAVMKLYEQNQLDINKTLGDYLPWVKGSNKENLLIKDILLHQAGLVAWIPFYRETVDKTGKPLAGIYSRQPLADYPVKVAEDLYLRKDYPDTMYREILQSKLGDNNKYIYSDNDFIFLGKIVEAITQVPLEDYVRETFYEPLNMTTTRFKPATLFPLNEIAPTEYDKNWRQQWLRGYVHDPAAAMFGGVAGHAGLFSNAYDLAQLFQMLLNGGEMNGTRYLKKETIDYFTAYSSNVSRRGLGFDKPEKDNAKRKDPYPTLSASPRTFGHTGFTGTCVWADPDSDLLYIFLSNRVSPDGENNTLLKMNVRSNIHELIYQALTTKPLVTAKR